MTFGSNSLKHLSDGVLKRVVETKRESAFRLAYRRLPCRYLPRHSHANNVNSALFLVLHNAGLSRPTSNLNIDATRSKEVRGTSISSNASPAKTSYGYKQSGQVAERRRRKRRRRRRRIEKGRWVGTRKTEDYKNLYHGF